MIPQDEQREQERAQIKIRLIENAVLVSGGQHGWFSFPTWAAAASHIEARLQALKKKRQEVA